MLDVVVQDICMKLQKHRVWCVLLNVLIKVNIYNQIVLNVKKLALVLNFLIEQTQQIRNVKHALI